eukprot:TRINITY_DN9175_c0_g1_i1.p1 TRINITY_DN9175_c0_g1~~TRINITY_DN9175_c0_g1_i1.p1  ORF type:complete len:440 (+),score=149.72 TRINITY_DN9175_c0_g1_i1:75-1322(+)
MKSFFFLALAICIAYALPYGKSSPVKELTSKNFAKEVINTEHVTVVEFYAPWCGHCKNLAPEYERLATKNKGIFKVAAINCDDEKSLCGQYDIKGFPTIKIFPSETVKSGKQSVKKPSDYNGQRTASAIANAVLSKVPSFVKTVTDQSLDGFIAESGSKALLFTDKEKTAPLYKSLSIDFKGRIALAEVRSNQKQAVEKYSVTKFPTLFLVKEDGEKVQYEGEIKHDKLHAFFSKYAKPDTKASASSNEDEEKPAPTPKPEFAWKTEDEVKDQETFEKICHDTSKLCTIALLDTQDTSKEEHAEQLALLSKLQEKNKDLFKLVWIDGPKNWEYAEKLGMAYGYPALVTYHHKKSAKIPYVGKFDEEDLGEYFGGIRTGTRRARPAPSFPSLPSAAGKKAEKKTQETEAPKPKDEL